MDTGRVKKEDNRADYQNKGKNNDNYRGKSNNYRGGKQNNQQSDYYDVFEAEKKGIASLNSKIEASRKELNGYFKNVEDLRKQKKELYDVIIGTRKKLTESQPLIDSLVAKRKNCEEQRKAANAVLTKLKEEFYDIGSSLPIKSSKDLPINELVTRNLTAIDDEIHDWEGKIHSARDLKDQRIFISSLEKAKQKRKLVEGYQQKKINFDAKRIEVDDLYNSSNDLGNQVKDLFEKKKIKRRIR